ncbi:shikimate dehydrogenase [Neptunomonas sp.]|uniref:shikimate dehydrogenase n=1 Tax=Neptunomonas sp. TaxID=1971898 RepID=UPI00356B38D0
MDRYAVFGNPISHSKSPAIHTEFAQQTSQSLTYEAICAPVGKFAASVDAFLADGGKGLNVTVPFKEDAWKMAEICSERAQLAGAVNTLYLNDQGQLCGENTDGVGMVRDIQDNYGYKMAGKRVLILGAGGAVRGVIRPVLEQNPREVVIANRTLSKAETLAGLFAPYGHVSASAFDALEGPFDLIINGTAASLQGEMPTLPEGMIHPKTWCYDMMYSAGQTPFNRWAEHQGAYQQLDGLGMLVEQAAESFYIWRGVRPDTAGLINHLRSQILNH